MGFNKLFLPEVEELKAQLLRFGNEEFAKYWVNRLMKYDTLSGSDAAMEFIKQFIQKEYEGMDPKAT